ncbi:MAG: hypothetical protein KGJ78_02330 [Alphaproteobacteria bacterium]|nr:hypothetical protein [Alphaproteobacteria bacterium]
MLDRPHSEPSKLKFWKRHHVPYLVTGHPRCATTSASEICKQVGLDVKDEEVGADGISSWMMAVDDRSNPFGNGELSRSRRKLKWDFMVLVVRNIGDAAPSVIIENRYAKASYDFRHKHILAQTGHDLAAAGDELSTAVLSITQWMRIILRQSPQFWFRIEDQQQEFRAFLARTSGRSAGGERSFADAKANAAKDYGVRYEKPKLQKNDWAKLSTPLQGEVRWYCSQFGYSCPLD